MAYQFRHHYTREEARELLPSIRQWLGELSRCQERIQHYEERFANELANGADLGGPEVDDWIRSLADFRRLLMEFHRREIFIKDLERGLVDFPAFVQGREVFLCWEQDEEDIEYWHDIDSGYAGREPL